MIRAAEAYAAYPKKSRYRALVKAGYSEATAINPSSNGLTIEKLERIHRRRAKGLKALVPLALETAKEELQEGNQRGALSVSVLKLAAEQTDDHDEIQEQRLLSALASRRARLNALLHGLTRQPSEAFLEHLRAELALLQRQIETLRTVGG